MSDWYEKYYWRIGFISRLYDLLTPESYLESMRKVAALLPDKRGQKVWDAGCGTGLLILFLKNAVKQGMIYYGSDVLFSGLSRLQMRAKVLRCFDSVTCFQNDITVAPIFKESSLDVVVAHFSIYTIRDYDKRQQVLKYMYRVLKPKGLLIVCCPSENYDADKIIEESCKLLIARKSPLEAGIKRILFYSFTKRLGLNFIKKQLESSQWVTYTQEKLIKELCGAGFQIGHSETVYAGGAYLMCGHKVSG
jgi:ubiquinone/menaquinone biosynthesis C-methylase UbiE